MKGRTIQSVVSDLEKLVQAFSHVAKAIPDGVLRRVASDAVAKLRSVTEEVLTSHAEEVIKWRKVVEYHMGEYADSHSAEECRAEAFKRSSEPSPTVDAALYLQVCAQRDALAEQVKKSARCRSTWVRCVLTPPGAEPQPSTGTRCALPAGHDGKCEFRRKKDVES